MINKSASDAKVEMLNPGERSQLPSMLTADEASDLLRLRKAQLYALAREGVVPAVRLGRTIRFSRVTLLAWIEAGGARRGEKGNQ